MIQSMQEKLSLKGRHIVIAGASSGLGKACAELLAKEGAELFLLARTIEETTLNFDAYTMNCDIRDGQSVAEAFEKIDEYTKKIDIFINCVGIGLIKNLEETTAEEVENVLATNLIGAILVCKEAYLRMVKQNSGHILNISSTSGIKARPDETVYCASKWGLRGFTDSLRLAAAPHKVRVTGVYPGGMQTNFWQTTDSKHRVMTGFMQPEDVATYLIQVMKTPTSIFPSDVVIERGL